MAFTYGNAWQNRPEEGEGMDSGEKVYYEPKTSGEITRPTRYINPEDLFNIQFVHQGETEIESFEWSWDEWVQEGITEIAQFSLNGCEYFWVESIEVDHDVKTVTVTCS
jgi:hypothetical protein